MNIKISSAINHFFAMSSFEMVFLEAVSNALDANADKVQIDIWIQKYGMAQTLRMTIKDNGVGFIDKNFERFSNLLLREDKNHKGVGRLVFLQYFKTVIVESVYESSHKRKFVFDENFIGKSDIEQLSSNIENYTSLMFAGFSKDRLKSYDNLRPEIIKKCLLNQFMPRLFAIKQANQTFSIVISLHVETPNEEKNFRSGVVTLTQDDLPQLNQREITDFPIDLFNGKFNLLYSIDVDDFVDESITAICIDGRAVKLNVINDSVIPRKVIFLLSSSFFDSKINESRQELRLSRSEEETVTNIFLEYISRILNQEIPSIKEQNSKTKQKLSVRFPHLDGFFDINSIGLVEEERALDQAQARFFKEQKVILNAESLDDEMYDRSLNHATRVLTEYILYRNTIIQRLSEMKKVHPESKINNLIVPMHRTFEGKTTFDDIYNNNAWLLDDKFMRYKYVLSDQNINQLIEKISEDPERASSDLRPDIAFVFSDDIDHSSHPVDVVVVELKKKGVGYLDNTRVVDQIEQRARRLLNYYPTKIQRMWFFGIVEFDQELKVKMRESWTPLFSKGDVFYREELMFPVNEKLEIVGDRKYPVSITLMSYEALWQDARNRNETFLQILKASISNFVENQNSKQKKI